MKILVGYVGSPEGAAALDAAVEEARMRDAELVVVAHVRVTGAVEDSSEAVTARDELEQLERRLGVDGVRVRTHWSVGMQSAAAALLSYADEEGADLIVLGLRRRSPVGKLVLGSNSQDVLLGAKCPVLAVKAPEEE